MTQAGLNLPEGWDIAVTHQGVDFSKALAIMALPPNERPTAIFAWSDDVAIYAMSHLRDLGLRVPEDVAVVGYDSTSICAHTEPPLTSVRQPIYAMARRATELLVAHIEEKSLAPSQIIELPELVLRSST